MNLANGCPLGRQVSGWGLVLLLLAGCANPLAEAETTPAPTPMDTPGVIVTPAATAAVAAPAIPPEIERYAAEWPLANHNYSNTRVARDAAINADTVNELGIAWTFPIPGVGSYGGAASNPLIANGVVYFQDLDSNVFALDFERGAVIWEHRLNERVIGPNGPAIGWGKLFAQGGENTVHALDLQSGKELWVTQLAGPTGAQQPYAYGGYLFTAAVAGAVDAEIGAVESRRGYAAGTSGQIYALDEASGEIAWNFQVVEEGFWGNPTINGGGGVWYPPAIDLETGVTFWGTGNPAPFPGILDYPNAASRPGPNLYTNSLVALGFDSGELIWYNQVKPRDLFDLDFQAPPMLATLTGDGTEQAIVIGSGKLGRVVAFDRTTGETIWNTPVGEHENDELEAVPLGEEIRVLPGVWGGVETPMALADGVIYAPVLNLPTPYTATGFDAVDGTEAVANATGRTQLPEATSELVALAVQSGEILWSTTFDAPGGFAGATVVNDLVFTALFDGTIYALARADGAIVWEFAAPGGIIAWPAVANDTIIFPVGIGERPVLMALRLGATGATEQADAAPAEADNAEAEPGEAEATAAEETE